MVLEHYGIEPNPVRDKPGRLPKRMIGYELPRVIGRAPLFRRWWS
jgi:hypothetical protein